jgi:hypothetical protein
VATVLTCVIAYTNKTEDWEEGYKILRRVQNLARSSTMKERVETNLKSLDENKKIRQRLVCT